MRFALIILGCLLSSYGYANKNVYKCIDTSGKKNYQSSPCAAGISNTTLNIDTGSSTDLDEEQKKQKLAQEKDKAKIEEQELSKKQLSEKREAINKEAIAESSATQKLIKENPKQYSPFAIPPYQPDKLSDLVKKYQDRLPDIERFRRAAAQKALATDQCERVEGAELDVKSTEILLSFLINCSTGKAFYYTEQDFK